ncbi:UDP-N-acetylmuramoyl-L-alanine--D-glutamate ligase [Patescibacteria group bacterium]|nr:UDP-N-acetylmuramoyl-L-alanine--D-glutamate ligase [Patescibacteria group bacterium]
MGKNLHIAILGHGIEGKSAEAYLKKHGYKVTVLDEKDDPAAFKDLTPFDTIFRSPGIRFDRPEIQASLSRLNSVTRYFFEHCPCPIIGVTGTKGKGTTSTLLYKILKNEGHRAHLGGNIGDPPLDFLDDLTQESLVVLELSSFQLEDLPQSPHIAIVLNTTSDHLDYHPSVEAYHDAKKSIVSHQLAEDFAILNGDYEGSRAFAKLGAGEKLYYSTIDPVEGAHLDNDKIIVLSKQVATTKDVALRGAHNLENVLPAALAATLLNVKPQTIKKTLREFTGLPHRLEFVATHQGVQYFNDSFSTTPETSIAAIKAFQEPLYLIAGGSEKHSDFTDWGRAVVTAKNLKKVLLIGQTATRLASSINDPDKFIHVHSLQGAFAYLKKHARPDEVVLLSPACASLDQFENYKVRGETFRQLVKNLDKTA